jgi:hypothetical protein
MNIKHKYLKYKNKYLKIKNQKGGTNDEFPKEVLDKYVRNNCFQSYNLHILDSEYSKLNDFFNIVNTTYENKFYPNTTINESNFIGKTSFVKEDIKKIWSRLNKSIDNNVDTELFGISYEHTQNQFIPIDDFIIIEDYKIFINGNKYDYNGVYKYDILFQVSKKIKYKNSNTDFDHSQLSGIGYPFEWEIYKGTQLFETYITTLFGKSIIKDEITNNGEKINYQHCGNFVIFYISNKFLICYVEQNAQTLKMFPFGFKNLLLNTTYEKPTINLFNSIKQQLESIYTTNLDQNTKIYEQIKI